jgi:hypothetical protein
MSSPQNHRTDAEIAILEKIASLQQLETHKWRGLEQMAVIELVRGLDFAAVSEMLHPAAKAGGYSANKQTFIPFGALTALRPFLERVGKMSGDLPWGRTPASVARDVDDYLVTCGQLALLLRLAALERYGLASTSFPEPGKIVIETGRGLPELANVEVLRAWQKNNVDSDPMDEAAFERERNALVARMRSRVDLDPHSLIRYENDLEIADSYLREARRRGKSSIEGEAFPPDLKIGGRSFGEWKDVCEQALGRVLCHIEFALLLYQKHPGQVSLRDILTIPTKREDVASVWIQAGMQPGQVKSTIAALELSVDRIDEWERAFEPPTPFYIGVGQDFVLAPCFGALANPYFSLFRHLKSEYRVDWDRGVDCREDVFRSDLSQAFPEPRFSVPAHGFGLKRPDGSMLTDIDAVILDRHTGTLGLVQLKWHDIFGMSLAELDSRRRNIAEANKWVERVLSWVDGRSSTEVLCSLGVDGTASARPPVLYVIARYHANFSGMVEPDRRAMWLAWPEILHDLKATDDADPLAHLASIAAVRRSKISEVGEVRQEFHFPGLQVNVRIAHHLFS